VADERDVAAAVERLRDKAKSVRRAASKGYLSEDASFVEADLADAAASDAVCDALAEAQREIDGDPQQCASSDPMISLGLKGMLAVCIEERIEAEALARTLAQTMDAIDDYDQGVHGFRAILADPRVKALLKD